MIAMAKEQALVTPAMLAWARTSMNFDVATAAAKAQVKPANLQDWEAGIGHPSIPQARRLAGVYKRPLAALFLPAPPRDFMIPHDFRRLPDTAIAAPSPRLVEAIRLAEYRRTTALELAAADEGASDLVGIATLNDDPEALAARVRGMLGIRLAVQRRWGNEYDALNGWKAAIEAHSVLVFHFSRVEVDEARAFSLAEDRYPVVAVNGGDKPRPRIFSLMHELCHVALRLGGISDFHERDPDSTDTQVEVFCNRFAGALLVPGDALGQESLGRGAGRATTWTDDELGELARYYWVSREVVLRRLLILGKTSEAFYQQKRDELRARQRQQEEDDEGGGFLLPPRGAIRSVGQPFARLVLGAYYGEAITLSDVSELLGVRVKHVPAIEALLEGRNVLTGGDR
jgi:Zn-dependent peptidase ImmA (M78 family)